MNESSWDLKEGLSRCWMILPDINSKYLITRSTDRNIFWTENQMLVREEYKLVSKCAQMSGKKFQEKYSKLQILVRITGMKKIKR